MRLLPSFLSASAILIQVSSSNAQQLQLMATVSLPSGPLGVAANGPYVYTANFGDNTLKIHEASVPASPILRSSAATGAPRARNVVVSGSNAYVTGYGTGSPSIHTVTLFNVATPTAPVAGLSISLPGMPVNTVTNGTIVCTVNRPLDINAAGTLSLFTASLAPLGSVSVGLNPLNVTLHNSLAYVLSANYTDRTLSLQIFDVSTPTAPTLRSVTGLGSLGTGSLQRIFVRGTTAYVTDTQGTRIVDVTPGNVPVVLATTSDFFSTVAGAYGYSLRAGMLQVFDLTKSTPVLQAATPMQPGSEAAVSGNTIYVINTSSLQIFQYSPVTTNTTSTAVYRPQLYPNPVSTNQVELSIPPTAAPTYVDIYNAVGQQLRRETLAANSQRTVLDLSNLPAGIYWIRHNNGVTRLIRR